MKGKRLVIFVLICCVIALLGCKEDPQYKVEEPAKKTAEGEVAEENNLKPIVQKYSIEEMVEKILKNHPIRNKELKKVINEFVYDAELVKTFTYLADMTDGEIKYAENSQVVISKILGILDQHVTSQTDVVLIFDRTSSMMDDLEETKKNIDLIINKLGRLENIRISVVTFGDKNADGRNWYKSIPLTNNYDMVKDFVKELDLLDGGDYPESVNDAIYKMVNELNWSNDAHRIAIVLGDAPSHLKPYSTVDVEEVVELCKQKEVMINFYPIIIAMESMKKEEEVKDNEDNYEIISIISKIRMNYTKDFCNIELKTGNRYKMELFSNRGEKLKETQFFGNSFELDIRNYKNGSYVLRIVDETNKQLDGQFFTIDRKAANTR